MTIHKTLLADAHNEMDKHLDTIQKCRARMRECMVLFDESFFAITKLQKDIEALGDFMHEDDTHTEQAI